MPQTNLLLKNAASRIGGAMDRLKFDNSLSTEDFQKIRADVAEARNEVNMFNAVNQDTSGLADMLDNSIEFLERTLMTLDDTPNLI